MENSLQPPGDGCDREGARVMASEALSKLGCHHHFNTEEAGEMTLGAAPAMQI